MEDSKLENILRKGAIGLGIILLVASIYLSYDGFDQQVGVTNEGLTPVAVANDGYTPVAVAIGYALAITCTLLQFMVASKNENLNSTIRWLGLGAYAYSIGTNFLGLTNLLEMKSVMAGISAVFMDVAPEQMIAWGLGEAVMHDLFGNFGKFATAPIGKSSKGNNHQQSQQKPQQHNQPKPQSQQPFVINKHREPRDERLAHLQRQHHASDNGKNSNTQPQNRQ